MEKNEGRKALLEKVLQEEKERLERNLSYAEQGVVFLDIRSAYIEESVQIGRGTFIGANAVLEGNTVIGENCSIGMGCRIKDCTFGNGVIAEYVIALESRVDDNAKLGPFAYLRPGSHIGENAKVGDFVEVKNADFGKGSKAAHLTYIGDADVGEGVNLGCGVVFVNYDGKNKYRSKVGDKAFIGCNVNLVSPVEVGDSAYIAAGTTVTEDVPEGALTIGRSRQKDIPGWVEKRRAEGRLK